MCMCCQLDSSDKQQPAEFNEENKVLPLQYIHWLLVSLIIVKVNFSLSYKILFRVRIIIQLHNWSQMASVKNTEKKAMEWILTLQYMQRGSETKMSDSSRKT